MAAPVAVLSKYNSYPKCSTHSLGVIQLICGILSIICGIVGFPTHAYNLSSGIGFGALYAVTGGLAIGAYRTKGSKCLVIATLVMSIICAVSAGAQLIMVIAHTVGVHIGNYQSTNDCLSNPSYNCHLNVYSSSYYCNFNYTSGRCDLLYTSYGSTTPATTPSSLICIQDKIGCYIPDGYRLRNVSLGFAVILCVAVLVELIASITHSAYICSTVCCTSTNRPAVMYYQVSTSDAQPGQIVLQMPAGHASGVTPGMPQFGLTENQQPPVYQFTTQPVSTSQQPYVLPPAVASAPAGAPPVYQEKA